MISNIFEYLSSPICNNNSFSLEKTDYKVEFYVFLSVYYLFYFSKAESLNIVIYIILRNKFNDKALKIMIYSL